MAIESLAADTILQLVNAYGLPLVALILFVRWLKPKFDKIFEIALRQDRSDERGRRFPDRMLKVMDINEKVMDMLRTLIVEYESSRITVFSYHNGGHNITGLDFARASCTHEVVTLGNRPIQTTYQAVPVTLFHSFNKKVLSGEGVRCVSVDCFKENDASTYESLRMQGVKSVYCVGLYTENGIPIGFMMVDYCKDNYEMDDEQFNDLKDLASRIATLLCMCGGALCDGGEFHERCN